MASWPRRKPRLIQSVLACKIQQAICTSHPPFARYLQDHHQALPNPDGTKSTVYGQPPPSTSRTWPMFSSLAYLSFVALSSCPSGMIPSPSSLSSTLRHAVHSTTKFACYIALRSAARHSRLSQNPPHLSPSRISPPAPLRESHRPSPHQEPACNQHQKASTSRTQKEFFITRLRSTNCPPFPLGNFQHPTSTHHVFRHGLVSRLLSCL